MGEKRIHLNPDLFIFFKGDEICLWDYRNQGNFTLEKKYLERIVEIATSSACPGHELDAELVDAKVVTLDPPEESPWEWGVPARIFHFATRAKFPPIEAAYKNFADYYIDVSYETYKEVMEPELRTTKSGPVTQLPAPNIQRLQRCGYWECLTARKTTRDFYGESLSLQVLSDVLYTTFGEIHGEWKDVADAGLRLLSTRKSSPAGGGIHAHDAYIVVRNVEGVSPGVYFYQCDKHHLVEINRNLVDDCVVSLLGNQDFAAQIPALVCVVSRFDRYWQKYKGSRAYRVSLLDVGHISQTFHLTAAAVGTCSWVTAAFDDDQLSKILGLQPEVEAPMLVLGIGDGSGDFLTKSFRSAIKAKRDRANFF